jgi:esterase/lipase
MKYPKLKSLILFPLIYSGLCLLLYKKQNSLLYFPDKTDSYNNETWNTITTHDGKILALESLDDYPKAVILFHGNSKNANVRTYYKHFLPKNAHTIVAEYPGFGTNQHMTITKQNMIDHARELMAYAKEKYGDNISLVGESLGTGIASQMANEFNIKNLLLITPYTSIAEVAQNKYWYAPVSLILKNNYNSVENLKNYQGKTLFVISENDEVIPPKFAHKLFDSVRDNKEQIVISGAGHSNWMQMMKREQRSKLIDFLS